MLASYWWYNDSCNEFFDKEDPVLTIKNERVELKKIVGEMIESRVESVEIAKRHAIIKIAKNPSSDDMVTFTGENGGSSIAVEWQKIYEKNHVNAGGRNCVHVLFSTEDGRKIGTSCCVFPAL
jgi:hypothetical protein